MDIAKIGLTVDSWVQGLNMPLKTIQPKSLAYSNYGRGLEQASGLGYWFVALTFAFGVNYGLGKETLQVNNSFWMVLAGILGFCQIYYNKSLQRKIFNIIATCGWLTIAITSYFYFDGWNLLTSVALPYCLCTFYSYGFLIGKDIYCQD